MEPWVALILGITVVAGIAALVESAVLIVLLVATAHGWTEPDTTWDVEE